MEEQTTRKKEKKYISKNVKAFKEALDDYMECKDLAKSKNVHTENIVRLYEIILYKKRTEAIQDFHEEMYIYLKELSGNIALIKDAMDTIAKNSLDRG